MRKGGRGKRKESEEGGRRVHGRRHEWMATAYLGKGTGLEQSEVLGIRMAGGVNPVCEQSNVPWREGRSKDL